MRKAGTFAQPQFTMPAYPWATPNDPLIVLGFDDTTGAGLVEVYAVAPAS
ncbi:MAG: hypothetical protein ABI540_09065 [Spartobacteria bacterium]